MTDAIDRREAYYAERLAEKEACPDRDPIASEALLNFLFTYDVLERQLVTQLQRIGISPSAFNILMILRVHRDMGLPLSQISELLLVSRANITGVVDSLEALELVSRTTSESDRRSKTAKITDKGLRLITEFLPEHYLFIKKLMSGLTADEQKTLATLLKKLRRSVQHASLEEKK